MQITWKELTIDPDTIDSAHLLDSWRWLVEPNMQPMIVSSMGDLFLRTLEGKVYWLNTVDGQIGLAAESVAEFREEMTKREATEEWFLPGMVGQLLEAGVKLGPGECYSFTRPPILGGAFEVENVKPCSIAVHFGLMGQLHEQIKDLPEGTPLEEIEFQIE